MSWTRLTSISVTNGSAIVTVNSGSTINIKVGDALLIGGFDLVEIEGVFANQLQLGSNWNHATQSNVAAAIVPTFGDFNHAVEEIRKLRQATADNLEAMEQWWTKPEGSVVFQSYDGKQFEARSVQQMEKDVAEIEERAESMMTDINAWGFARTEADMIADRERNNQLYAASGPIHHGKHWDNAPSEVAVNEGMNSLTTKPNSFRMGRRSSDGKGKSKTPFAVYNLAGITAHLQGLSASPIADTAQVYGMELKLPPAPKGTEVYDSATGVLTNFETEIDPKYGDVAADVNEAVARAFEGLVKNGDFRLGDSFWSSAVDRGTMSIQDGKCTLTDTTGLSLGGSAMWATVEGTAFVNGETYVVEIFVDSLVNEGDAWVRLGHYQDPEQRNETIKVGINRFEFTAGITGSSQGVLIYAGKNGTLVFSSFSARKKSAEVVISPVDLVGVELFLRPVNEADPFVYPYGMQQSKLTSVDGIATVENNVRPITHFEVYTGDTTSRGRGWNLLDGSLSDAQKAKVFQNPEHNIYRISDGTLVQWTASARTFRGAGNGDWENVNPARNASGDLGLIFKPSVSYVSIRGQQDSVSPFVGSDSNWYQGVNAGDSFVGFTSQKMNKGIFIPRRSTSEHSHNGECYFYVIATVPRLNQGAYHLNLNPNGTKMCNTVGVSSSGSYWYDSNSLVPLTTSECFRQIDATSDSTTRGAALSTGAISSSYSGHPNNLRFDAIYASGQGGIIDQRLKYGAWDATSAEQAAVVREEVKNGTYRGREKLKASVPFNTPATSGVFSSKRVLFDSTTDIYRDVYAKFGATQQGASSGATASETDERTFGYFVAKDGITTYPILGFGVDVGTLFYFTTTTAGYEQYRNDFTTPISLVLSGEVSLTVEGKFYQIDVMGSPVNILQVDALKNGWLGGCISDFTSRSVEMTREAVDSSFTFIKNDDGVSWGKATATVDLVNNTIDAYFDTTPNRVGFITYKAFAAQTEPSANLSVFNGERGLSSVFASSNYRTANGSLLSESLFGNVLKSDGTLPRDKCYTLTGFAIASSEALETSGNMTTHSQIDLSAPTSGDKAFKALYCQSSSDQQANLNIIANELIYSSAGGNWGDDAKLKIVADGTFTDLNGNRCKAAIHKLAKPYGFIKM